MFSRESQSEKSAPPGLEISLRIAICALVCLGAGRAAAREDRHDRRLVGRQSPTPAKRCSATWCGRWSASTSAAACARPRACGRCSWTRYDSKGQNEEALSALRAAIDDGAHFILQGNSSAIAAALIEAINKHNEREPGKRVLFLNYSAVDPILTNEKCSFWHFRFDAHADMRMAALMEVLKDDKSVGSRST